MMAEERNIAVPLEGVPQIPDSVAWKFNAVERYLPGKIKFTKTDRKRVAKAIEAACEEIKRRRLLIMPPQGWANH